MRFRISTFFPDHLDLNGDQANLLVAQKRLEWLGFQVVIEKIEKGTELPHETDLIFVGHGSLAAWADIADSMTESITWISKSIQEGSGFMAVASGHEWAIRSRLLAGDLAPTERISKFEIVELDGREILGYLNSSTNAPIVQKNSLLLGTQLHGPILAKNPDFADTYLLEIATSRGILRNTEVIKKPFNNKADLVAGIVDQVWELERELASE
jgi:CobQ-like glutamine amidotransferase family enzyme